MTRRTISLFASAVVTVGVAVATGVPAQATTNSYVALGDSYAAGTGLSTATGQPCLRATTGSYPEDLKVDQDETCSGATTTSVTGTQLPAVKTSIGGAGSITLTVGGNDIGFSNVLTNCVSPFAFLTCSPALKTAKSKFSTLTTNIKADIAAIRKLNSTATIYVTDYPQLFGTVSTTSCPVGGGLSITKTNAGNLDAATGPATQPGTLAAAISAAVPTTDATLKFIEVDGSFQGHRVCNHPVGQLINGYVSSPSTQSFHPNLLGEQAYAAAVSTSALGSTTH